MNSLLMIISFNRNFNQCPMHEIKLLYFLELFASCTFDGEKAGQMLSAARGDNEMQEICRDKQ